MGLVRRMSYSSCCCLHSPSPAETPGSSPRGGGTARRGRGEGSRRLVVTGLWNDAVEEDFTSATSRAEMDIALLRQQYRWTREKQMRENRVIVFRRVSEDLTEAMRVIPVTQQSRSSQIRSSLWDTTNNNSSSSSSSSRPLPHMTLLPVDPTLVPPDPWHAHLDLHRRINGPAGMVGTPPAATSNMAGPHLPPSPRRHSCLSETGSVKPKYRVQRYSVDSAAGLNGSCPDISLRDPLPGYVNSAQESHPHLDGSLRIPPREEEEGEGTGDSLASTSGGTCSVGSSVNGDSAAGSLTSFDESDTPVRSSSRTPSTCSSVADPNEIGGYDGGGGGYGPAYHTFGKLAVPAPIPIGHQRFGMQHYQPTLAPVHHHLQHQHHPNYNPFPNRKSIKKSEAAMKLGMYSHF